MHRYFAHISLLLLCLVALSSCNLRPVYSSDNRDKMPQIRVVVADNDLVARYFADDLQDKFVGAASGKVYTIEADIRQVSQPVILDRNRTILRSAVVLEATYRLIDEKGEIVNTGNVSTKSGYNVVQSEYATYSAEHNSEKLAAVDLSQTIYRRVVSYFRGKR